MVEGFYVFTRKTELAPLRTPCFFNKEIKIIFHSYVLKLQNFPDENAQKGF